jgi:hypothetical protein
MAISKSNRRGSAWLRAMRIAALALLALIALDMQDAGCDPFDVAGPLALGEAPRHQAPADACASGCIPDCFCCSSALPAPAFDPLLPADAVTGWTLCIPPSPALGFSTQPDHVPIA